MSTLLTVLYGALIAMCLIAAMFFVRYGWLTKDRFFFWFAFAFAAFALNWGLVVHELGASEHAPLIYGVRLVGFLAIGAAILLKNRTPSDG